jgi:hypothetical protein
MGGLIVIVAVIIIVIFLRKAKKEGHGEREIESLMNSDACKLALIIRDELNKKGYNGGEPKYDYTNGYASGQIGISLQDHFSCCIHFSEHPHGTGSLHYARERIVLRRAKGQRVYGIENANIGILVSSENDYLDPQDIPEYIVIATEVIKNNGYGSSTMIEYRD